MRELLGSTGNPAAGSKVLAPFDAKGSPEVRRRTGDEQLRYLVARVNDPTVPRGERYHTLYTLTFAPCSNVRGLLFGPSDDVKNAVARARPTLPRYPSERAIVDLDARVPQIRGSDFDRLGLPSTLAVAQDRR
ncbi:MAG: hypothetical protein H0W68_13565 [Gemmatimonadaceae bacterium]|nr:hypothetical protein [Gemmatimonadaceae bacterium]